MSDTQFFVRGRTRGNERKIILSSATLLVGKAPTKTKQIKLKVRMPLSGQKIAGTPEWIANAMTFVGQSHDIVTPQIDLSGFDVAFSDDTLFEAKATAVKAQLRKFTILEAGDSESPDIEMQFSLYSPFSTVLWKFYGQMGGEEVWAKFTQVVEPRAEGGDLELTGDEDEQEEEGEPEEVA